MDVRTDPPRRRGRPPKRHEDLVATRDVLLRTGLEVLTEKGFSATGLDEILGRAGVPKGSFYHYFDSKDAFGLELIDRYAEFFARKLDRHFSQLDRTPQQMLGVSPSTNPSCELGKHAHGCDVEWIFLEVRLQEPLRDFQPIVVQRERCLH